MKSRRVCIKTRSPPASLPLKGQVTGHTTVKWPIALYLLVKQKENLTLHQESLRALFRAPLQLTQDQPTNVCFREMFAYSGICYMYMRENIVHHLLRLISDLIIGSDINHDREADFWINSAAHCVESKLADRYPHSTAAKVTQAKNALTICHHNGLP